MPKKRPSLTAAEFVEKLQADPQYQAGLEARRRRSAQIGAEAGPLLDDLRAAGFPVGSLGELRHAYSPLPREIVQILLRWLPMLSEPALQDQIVRDLANVEEPYEPRVLMTLYETSPSEVVRWSIANTLSELRPLDAREWVIAALENRSFGRAREMLPLALARIAPRDVANPILLKHLDEMPGHVALGLAESGGLPEAEALRQKAAGEKGWIRKELERAIRKIEKRIA